MNVTGQQNLTAVLLELQDVAARIDQAIREGGLNITDQQMLARMTQDIAYHIRILNARLELRIFFLYTVGMLLYEFCFRKRSPSCKKLSRNKSG
jgi:hypothetical protein